MIVAAAAKAYLVQRRGAPPSVREISLYFPRPRVATFCLPTRGVEKFFVCLPYGPTIAIGVTLQPTPEIA